MTKERRPPISRSKGKRIATTNLETWVL